MLYVQYIKNENKFPIWDLTFLDPLVYFIKGRIQPQITSSVPKIFPRSHIGNHSYVLKIYATIGDKSKFYTEIRSGK